MTLGWQGLQAYPQARYSHALCCVAPHGQDVSQRPCKRAKQGENDSTVQYGKRDPFALPLPAPQHHRHRYPRQDVSPATRCAGVTACKCSSSNLLALCSLAHSLARPPLQLLDAAYWCMLSQASRWSTLSARTGFATGKSHARTRKD